VPSRRSAVFISAFALLAVPTLGAPVAAVAEPTSAASLGSRTLRAGVSGADVRELQQLLQRAGFDVTADGSFASATAEAVKAFQAVAGLTPSGTAGRKTVARLRAATRSGASAANNGGVGFGSESAGSRPRARALGDRIPVRRGMSGRDVKMLQDFLKRAGVRRVTVDGEFGTGTIRAVRAWEREADRRVDGVVDAADIHTLRTAVGAVPGAQDGETSPRSAPLQLAAGSRAKVGDDGLAIAPADAPDAVKQIIAAGNEIATKPYRYGGGHGRWKDAGYDCSGSVSYALHGAGLLETALPSSGFFGWGEAGEGQWVTIYTKSSHMFMVVAGLRFDTSGRSRAGTRWQADMRDTSGYRSRHPAGL
jgi:peptidoglycan hydrolase-like protein with peptidoglycan-binding domain